MSFEFWGTELKRLYVFREGERISETDNTFAVIISEGEDREEPRFVEIEGVSLDPGEYTVVYCQMGFNPDGRSRWKSIVIPRCKVIEKTTRGVRVEVLRLWKILPPMSFKWAENFSKAEPIPEDLLRSLRLYVKGPE